MGEKIIPTTAFGHLRRCGLRRCSSNPEDAAAASCDVSSVHLINCVLDNFLPLVPAMTGIIVTSEGSAENSSYGCLKLKGKNDVLLLLCNQISSE